MKILSVHSIINGSAFIIGDDIPTSLIVWVSIGKIINDNFPNLYARVMPGPHEQTDNDIIEVFSQSNEIPNPEVHKLIENISINRSGGCKLFYKGQIINPD